MPVGPQQDLEAGATLSGVFWPAGADFATPGVLSWSDEGAAVLQLTVLDDPWPKDFNRLFTVHAELHGYIGTPLTLMQSRVTRKLSFDQPSLIKAQTLAIGAHTDADECWPVAHFMPHGLHEWYPETGLSFDFLDKRNRHPRISWKPPKRIKIPVPGAEITLNPGADWRRGGPEWRIDTSLQFTVRPEGALTLDAFWRQYRSPLLGFVMFARMSRSPWNLVAASRRILSGKGSAHLLRRGGVTVQLAFDRKRESGEIGVTDDAAELALGFEHPGGGPTQAHLT